MKNYTGWLVTFYKGGIFHQLLLPDADGLPTVRQLVALYSEHVGPTGFEIPDLNRNSTVLQKVQQFFKLNKITYRIVLAPLK